MQTFSVYYIFIVLLSIMKKTKGIITAGHSQTAWAGIQILNEGGNAFDAAIATTLAACINEFCMCSLGGGTFFNLFTQNGKSVLIDAFCQTPKQKRSLEQIDFYPHTIDFGGTQEDFQIGMGSIATPGTLAGIYALHEQFATLPFKVLIEPALEIARKGSIVDDFQAFDYGVLESMLRVHPESKALFVKEDDCLVKEGDVVGMPVFADFLECLRFEGKDLFYKGETARKIAADSQEKGGFISYEDLESYQPVFRNPLQFKYRGHTILTNDLPSIGGALIALGLDQLQHVRNFQQHTDPNHTNRLFEVFSYLETVDRTVEGLSKLLAQKSYIQSSFNRSGARKWGSTTHFNIMDEHGNAISVTTSNGEGSGYMIEGTNVMLNNMLGEAALLPGGFHSWEPDTRLSSMMSPTLILDDQDMVRYALGTGGAGRIPTMVLQVISYLLDYKMPVQDAIAAPRCHVEHGSFDLEPELWSEGPFNIEKVSQWPKKHMYYGGVHTIERLAHDQFAGVGDSRRSGVVMTN